MVKTYSEKTRYEILSFFERKTSKKAVSKKFGVPYTTVCNIITKRLN